MRVSSALPFLLVAIIALAHPAMAQSQIAAPPEKTAPLGATPEAASPPEPEVSPAAVTPASPLVWWNREITTFRSTTAQLSPEARTVDAKEKFDQFSDQLLESPITTETAEVDGEETTRFLVGDEYLFSLLASDLDELAGQSLKEESQQIASRMEEIRQARLEQGSAEAIAKGVTKAVVATVIFIAALFVLRMVSGRLALFVERRIRSWKRLRLARTDLRPHFGLLGKQFIRVLFFLFGFYLFCIWVAFAFNQFPLTEPLGAAFTEHLKSFATGILKTMVAAIPGLATAALILFVTRWLANLIDRVVRSMGDDSDSGVLANDAAKATRRISVACVWIIGVVLAYPYLPGSGSDAFKGISVLLGLMVSLGSSGMINQVMSGFVLLYSGSVRTGEYIKVGEIEGTITEMGILACKVLTPPGEFLIIPNAVMITNPTTNYSRLKKDTGVPISSVVTIGYDAPWRQVHELLIAAANETQGIVASPEPRVLQKALSDWYAEYTLTIYAAEPQGRGAILSELNGHIQDAFNEAGIQIMSPHYQKDPPQPMVIPKDRWFPSSPGKE
ncbi:mechanosensitive ion channel domain-containing protein [Haloferula sp.]|uniref:mechanosensitive ion channel domain-containing protein n=1 Tax=Haloferula sp. TaxID=2497595 RepID=UPI003C79099D